MKCPKCNKKNITKASYCISCKYEFTEEEQEKAYNKTLFGRLDSIETWYNHLTLATVTDHILFKLFLLLLVFLTGLWYYFNRGIDTAILESKYYEIYHNNKNDDYYLIIDDETKDIKLNVYKPNRVKSLKLIHYSNDDKEIENFDYDEESSEKISLKAYNNDYYVLKSTYDKKTDNLKIFIYPKSRVDFNK